MENSTQYLLSWGCDPNLKDLDNGMTPLHLAVMSGNTRVVKKMVVKGGDIELQVRKLLQT